MSTAENPVATHNGRTPDGASSTGTASHGSSTQNGSMPNGSTPNGSAMFSGAGATVQHGGQKPETEQLNLRIRADLYRQLDRMTVVLGARRGVPTNRVTVVEEALAAYFDAHRTS